jgi:hypothetical protein
MVFVKILTSGVLLYLKIMNSVLDLLEFILHGAMFSVELHKALS